MNPVDTAIQQKEIDAYLIYEDSDDSDMYYATGLDRSDSFIYLRNNGESKIYVSVMEYTRAEKEADVDRVVNRSDFEFESISELIRKIAEEEEIETLGVPEDFPLRIADRLREGLEVETVESPFSEPRKVKNDEEIEKLRTAQEVTENAMQHVKTIIEDSEAEDGKLLWEDEVLTSEKARREIRKFLAARDCEMPRGVVVSCGEDAAEPHSKGEGPLKPGEPILVDIFPKHDNRYWGDMSRTFVKGEASGKIEEMKKAVEQALEEALVLLEDGEGVEAAQLYNKVCDVLEEEGFQTLRQDRKAEQGFIHSAGHAVGLDIHERPVLSDRSDEELKAGNVLTVEPGVYIPGVGGVRIEDMVLVKEHGYENFNSMSREMRLS